MFLKIVAIFLLVMMLIGMVGKLLHPDRKSTKKLALKCPKCNGFIIGAGPCARCAKKGK